jgi:hypothetical protein
MSGLVGVESDFVTSPATGVKFAFQWYRDGVALKGKTQFVYLEKSPDIGKDITLRITASKAGYKSTAQFSNAVVWHGTTGP